MKQIKTKEINNFSAIICLNGDLPNKDRIEQFQITPIISADGAAAKLLELGITPSLVIGDMDSFPDTTFFSSFPKELIIELPDQETNDFEKILNYCIANKYQDLLILGMHGGDLEHTLNNWSVFKKFSKHLNLYIFDRNRLAFCSSEDIMIHCSSGELISLIPQTAATLSTKNLKWNLNNETLEIGKRDGARNIATSEEVFINIHAGELLIFVDFL